MERLGPVGSARCINTVWILRNLQIGASYIYHTCDSKSPLPEYRQHCCPSRVINPPLVMAVETAERPASGVSSEQTVEPDGRFQRYRIRTGMFAWMAHRLSGVALVVYLIIHIWGLKSLTDPDAFNALIAKYHQPIFKIGEFLLLAAVVYHAMNGLRIVLIDFLGWSPNQKRLFWTLGAVAAILIIVGGYPSIASLVQWMGG